jgi:hypothetical protein
MESGERKLSKAETIRPALEVRLRLAGTAPAQAPLPEPDMKISDPKRRAKAFVKAARNVDHANKAAMAKALDEAKWEGMGCVAGRAIVRHPSRQELFSAVKRIWKVEANWLAAIGAPSPHPQGMNLDLMPEEFGSDGVEVFGGWDGRTEEERVKAATAAMMHLEGVLGRAGYGVLAEVKAVVLRDQAVRRIDRLIIGLAAVVKDA